MDREEQLKEISSLWIRKRSLDFLGVINMYIVVTTVLAMIAGTASSMSFVVVILCAFAVLSVLNTKRKVQFAMRKLRKEIGDDE